MTIWNARRARRGDTERILCGRTVSGQHTCDSQIALRYTYSAVVIPNGLTDDGSPGEYRWSNFSTSRIARNEQPSDKRPGPYRVPQPGLEGTATWIAESPKGSRRLASVPITLPCKHNHTNAIDSVLLQD